MIIGIEGERANINTKTGVEHYAKQLILHLAKLDNKNKYIIYLRTEAQEWIKSLPSNFTYKVMPFPFAWTTVRLSVEMLFNRPDVLFIPASSVPIITPKKTIAVIHDLAFWFYPQTYNKTRVFAHKLYDFLTTRLASKIITVSNSTKKDACSLYKVSEVKITVVHHGYEKSDFANLQPIHNLPDKYLLFLATLQPRKNLIGLIEAFKIFKQKNPNDKHKLVVVGKKGWLYESIVKAIEENKEFVEYLGHIDDQERLYIMKHASALALPSFYEGFGMQILEAFDAGVPVLTSDISSLPEVGGEAAFYCDPTSIQSISDGIEKVLLDEEVRGRLVWLGYERLKDFSWDKCAKETLSVIEGD